MNKRTLVILFFTLLLDMIGLGMVLPIIPVLFTDPDSPHFLLAGYSVGAQLFLAGLVTGLFGIMQFLAAPIFGELSDRFGRKKLLTLGVAVLAVSQLVFGWGIQIASIGLLLVARTVAGVAGANFSIAQAAIVDVSDSGSRAKNFGLIGAALGTGFVLGPVLSGWISNLTGNPAMPFWFAGVLGILNVCFITLFLPETNKNKSTDTKIHILKGIHNIRAALVRTKARPVYVANFLFMAGFAFFTSFIGVLLVAHFHLEEAGVGTFFGVAGAWFVLTQLVVLRFVASHYRERPILRYAILIVALCMAATPFLPDMAAVYALLPFAAVGQGLTMANMTSLVSKAVPKEEQGVALGINGSLLAFAQGLIPIFAGAASGLIGLSIPFFAAALFMAGSWGVLFVFRPR